MSNAVGKPMTLELTRKQQRSVIMAVTVGSVLEWYEIFLYAYWAPILSRLFFSPDVEATALINTLLIFAVGFLSRPIGGLVFGHVGDRYGRKISLLSSIVIIALPTFTLGLLPTYDQIGFWAPTLLVTIRILQGLPSGGELPGAMCYLAESAPPKKRRFMCSWTFIGSQIGITISIIECLLLEKNLSQEALLNWGWRLSFLIGGLIGLLGYFLRFKLKESPFFEELSKRSKIEPRPILEALKKYKKKLLMGFGFTVLDAVGIFVITVFSSVFFEKFLGTTFDENLMITASVLTLSTILLPLFGKLGDRFENKPLLIFSAIGIMIVAYLFNYAVEYASFYSAVVLEILMILFLNVQFALLPSALSELFPTSVRFTCMGLSYNICSSLIGSLIPIAALYWIHKTGATIIFSFLLAGAAFLSFIAFLFMKEKKALP
jgi:MHS family proline/betaine transporter-like MFS transporter